MTVSIPISADPASLVRSIQQISSALRQMGADAKAFENVDLSHPEIGGLTDDLRRVIANFEQLQKIGRGNTAASVRGVIRDGGVSGGNGLEVLRQWAEKANQAYADPRERDRHLQNVGQYVFQGTRFQPRPAPANDAGGGDDGGGEGGGGGGGSSGGMGSSITSGVSKAMKAASKEFLFAMLAYGGVKGVGALTSQAVTQGLNEGNSNDVLMRTIQGAATDFESLRQSVRETTRGLYLTFQEGQQLSEQFAKLTNETDPSKIASGVRTAAGFARAYGLDPTATNGTFASARYMGEDPRDFAELIAAAVSQGNMSGQADQVSQAILGFVQQAGRFMVYTAGAADPAASLYAAMNASGSPMLKGDNGLSLMSSANNSIMQGGGGGMAGQAIALQALAGNGITDPWKANYLLQGGAFATPGSMGIQGSANSNLTNYSAIKARIDALYPGSQNRYRRDMALGTMFNWTAPQADAMDSVSPSDLGYVSNWMMNHFGNLSSLNPTSVQDINSVLRPGADLQGWRKRVLAAGSGYTLSAADTQGLMGAKGDDALQQALVKALSDNGMSQTSSTQFQQQAANYSNNLTAIGSTLIPALTDLTSAVTALTGVIGQNMTETNPYAPVPNLAPFRGPRPPGWHSTRLSDATKALISNYVPAAARANGLDASWMSSLVGVEGWYGQDSSAGAIGPMQLLPGTAAGLGVNPRDLVQNIIGGNTYFSQLLKRFGGDYDVAAAAYNEGPNGKGIEHFYQTGDMSQLWPQTQAYVKNVEAGYAAGGGNLSTLHLRADPVVVVIKNQQGQVVGKAAVNLRGRATPSGQRQ